MILADASGSVSAIQIGAAVLSITAIMAMVKLAKDIFVRRPSIEQDFVMKSEFTEFKTIMERRIGKIEEKIDTSFLRIGDKLDDMKSEIMASGERRTATLHERINDLEAKVARVDERTSRAKGPHA